MALDLKDLRAKITPEAHCVLNAYADAHHMDVSELVRSIISAWANEQIHAATVMNKALQREGIVGKVRE